MAVGGLGTGVVGVSTTAAEVLPTKRAASVGTKRRVRDSEPGPKVRLMEQVPVADTGAEPSTVLPFRNSQVPTGTGRLTSALETTPFRATGAPAVGAAGLTVSALLVAEAGTTTPATANVVVPVDPLNATSPE